jgi:hypothetical protein
MPLFTVTMKSNGSTSEKDRLSRAIHAAIIAAGYPEDDLFQVHDDIWLVSFIDYDLGYFDLDTQGLEPIDNPFGPKLLPM